MRRKSPPRRSRPSSPARPAEIAARGMTGKAVTPALLQRMLELTDGRSLEANIALVLNNARLGARIARELTGMA